MFLLYQITVFKSTKFKKIKSKNSICKKSVLTCNDEYARIYHLKYAGWCADFYINGN